MGTRSHHTGDFRLPLMVGAFIQHHFFCEQLCHLWVGPNLFLHLSAIDACPPREVEEHGLAFRAGRREAFFVIVKPGLDMALMAAASHATTHAFDADAAHVTAEPTPPADAGLPTPFPMSNQPIPPAALRSRSSAATPSTATPFVAALANAATYPTLFRPAATDLVLFACNLACPVMIMKHTRWSGVVVALRVHLGSVAPCSIHSVSISLFCTSLPRSARFY